jgi:GNAT superfamily N-acetyltransferase
MEIQGAIIGEAPTFYVRGSESEHSLSQLDLQLTETNTYLMTRLIVNKKARGQGIGRELLQAACNDADHKNITLLAEINSYGEMGKDNIIAWLERQNFAFDADRQVYARQPQN